LAFEKYMKKLSHGQAKIVIVLTTMFAPIAAIPFTSTNGNVTTVGNTLSALFWHLGTSLGWEGWGIHIGELSMFNPGTMVSDMLWTLPTIPFAYKAIRYIERRSSKTTVYITAAISIIVPLVLGILSMGMLFGRGILVYAGPIPIQLVIGLLIVEGMTPQEKDQGPIDEEFKKRWWKNEPEVHSK
jgi:hypothetical protein